MPCHPDRVRRAYDPDPAPATDAYTRGAQDALKAVGDKWAQRCARAELALAAVKDKMK
jgi:hypothetical protein